MKERREVVQGWLEKARRDLITAERELESQEPFTDIACFHAQQAVEKGLKALLTGHGTTPPRTHVLEDLALLLARYEPEAEEKVYEVARLTPYAVASRYPELPDPSHEEAQTGVAIAREVLDWIMQLAPCGGW